MSRRSLQARLTAAAAALLGCLALTSPAGLTAGVTSVPDAEIRQRMIAESIRAYPGNCACPYNSAKNGSRCGGRSAYSRPGGHSPLCYDSDISDQMVVQYRQRNRLLAGE